ncbi:MAG: DUF1893 domain-containing protein [Firmicutes bacterium]|nr:DUF1893 domain-containing protein [Bacillota bacterium]
MNYEEAKKMLGTDGITCIVLKDGADPLISRIRGVRPVIQWIEEGADLKGAAVFDTIVGRAAAMMYALAGAGFVYGRVMSLGGAAELEKAGIKYEYGEQVDVITNRQGTGMCPMEQTVLGITDPAEAMAALKAKIAQMQAAMKK